MNIIFLGPQGSGKGTQAKLLSEKLNFFYFESGEFLRQLAQDNEIIRAMMDKGELVPSNEFSSYVSAYLDEKELFDNIIFDGFPRELSQYEFFKDWLEMRKMKIDLVFVLEINEETTLKRLILRAREDDTPEAIRRRLELYRKETMPLIDELKHDAEVKHINGEGEVEAIQSELEKIISENR